MNIPLNIFKKANTRKKKKTDDYSAKYIQKSEQTTEKNIDNYINIDPDILIVKFRMLYTGKYCDSELIAEAKAIIRELRRMEGVYWRKRFFALIIIYNKHQN